jgi:hypothetical protein
MEAALVFIRERWGMLYFSLYKSRLGSRLIRSRALGGRRGRGRRRRV